MCAETSWTWSWRTAEWVPAWPSPESGGSHLCQSRPHASAASLPVQAQGPSRGAEAPQGCWPASNTSHQACAPPLLVFACSSSSRCAWHFLHLPLERAHTSLPVLATKPIPAFHTLPVVSPGAPAPLREHASHHTGHLPPGHFSSGLRACRWLSPAPPVGAARGE